MFHLPTSKPVRETAGDDILGPFRLVQATGKLLAKMIEAKAAGTGAFLAFLVLFNIHLAPW